MMRRIISKLMHKDVLGISNEVIEDGKIRGYVLFVDVDTHNYKEVESIIADIGNFWGFVFKTRHGYHLIDLRIRSYRVLIEEYLNLVYEYGAIDKNHFCTLIRDGRNILRISGRYKDKLIFHDFITDGTAYEISKAHFLIYSTIAGMVGIKDVMDIYKRLGVRFVGDKVIYEIYKRRRW